MRESSILRMMNTNSTTSETLKKPVGITTDAIMDATIDAVMTDSTVTHTEFHDTTVAAA